MSALGHSPPSDSGTLTDHCPLFVCRLNHRFVPFLLTFGFVSAYNACVLDKDRAEALRDEQFQMLLGGFAPLFAR